MERLKVKTPPTVTVEAIIPSAGGEVVVDTDGNYPTIIHNHLQETYEDAFRRLGRKVLGHTLSVDRREHTPDGEQPPNHITYRAKPVAKSDPIQQKDGPQYAWK